MNNYDKITPEGTRDLLFEECYARNRVIDRMKRLFFSRGFDEVMTPSVEFYDLFSKGPSYQPQELMFKLCDSKGRLLVLRPDSTVPIARLVATRLGDYPLPVRLFYNQTAFRVNPELSGKSNEIPQIGVELIGSSSAKADLEILELAANSLRACTNGRFRIELCHIGFFNALMESLQASDAEKEQIRALIEQKNYPALGDLLERFVEQPAARALRMLPRLFGGEEVLSQAKELFEHPGAAQVLDYLGEIFRSLSALGLREQVLVDLGLVNQADYYTGVIFRGYLEDIGEPVCSGGRYDHLVQVGERALPATGFGVNVELLAKHILQTDKTVHKRIPDLLVYAPATHFVQALQYTESLARQGKLCENSLFDNLEQTVSYARTRGIPAVHVVGDSLEILPVPAG